MEENSLIIEQTNKMIKAKRRVFITNIILIVVLLLIGCYVFSNVELIKKLEMDVCRICELKTGANCFMLDIPK